MSAARGLFGWAAAVALATSCAAPLPIERRDFMLNEVAANYHDVFDGVGVLRPRFGLPAIVQAGAPISIEILDHAAAKPPRAALVKRLLSEADAERCVRGEAVDGCWPLEVTSGTRQPLGEEHLVTTLETRPRATPPPGGYDLVVAEEGEPSSRQLRAVWLRQDDPAHLSSLRVAQLSDLHIGKGDAHKRDLIHERLKRVVNDLNAGKPDLVILTGDVTNLGNRPSQLPEATWLLSEIEAPLLVVIGNHDHGFDRTAFATRHYGVGWHHFAHAFHPYLFYSVTLGGWDFVGFDSGPSEFSPLVLTRGLLAQTVEAIADELARARAANDHGVVLFSHAPSRALLTGSKPTDKAGLVGRMQYGSEEFEKVILDAAGRGQRILHLSGHTHWNELFEARGDGFVRWDHSRLWPGAQEIAGRAALINVQSATHTTYPLKDSGRGFGFVWLTLGEGNPVVDFQRYDARTNLLTRRTARPQGDHRGDAKGAENAETDKSLLVQKQTERSAPN